MNSYQEIKILLELKLAKKFSARPRGGIITVCTGKLLPNVTRCNLRNFYFPE